MFINVNKPTNAAITCLSFCPSVCLSVFLSLCLSFCLPVSVCLSIGLPICLSLLQVSGVNRALGRKREQRVLVMVIIMVVCYLFCWLPYGIMALLATFGPPGLVTPEASITPSVLAKTSTVINPIIYIFMNKQVSRRCRDAERLPQTRPSYTDTHTHTHTHIFSLTHTHNGTY